MILNLYPETSEKGFINFRDNIKLEKFMEGVVSPSSEISYYIKNYSCFFSSFFQNIYFTGDEGFNIRFFTEKLITDSPDIFKNLSDDDLKNTFLQFYTAFCLIKEFNLEFYDLSKFTLNSGPSVKFALSEKRIPNDDNLNFIVNTFREYSDFKNISRENINEIFYSLKDSEEFSIEEVFFFKLSEVSMKIFNKDMFDNIGDLDRFTINFSIGVPSFKRFWKFHILNLLKSEKILTMNIEPNVDKVLPYFKNIFANNKDNSALYSEEIENRIDEFIKGSQFSKLVIINDKTLDKEEIEFFNNILRNSDKGLVFIDFACNEGVGNDITINEDERNHADKYLRYSYLAKNYISEDDREFLKVLKLFPVRYDQVENVYPGKKRIIDQLFEKNFIFLKDKRLYVKDSIIKPLKISGAEIFRILELLSKNLSSVEFKFLYNLYKGNMNKAEFYMNKFDTGKSGRGEAGLKFLSYVIENFSFNIRGNKKLFDKLTWFFIVNGEFQVARELLTKNSDDTDKKNLLRLLLIQTLEEDLEEAKGTYERFSGGSNMILDDEGYFILSSFYMVFGNREKSISLSENIESGRLKKFNDLIGIWQDLKFESRVNLETIVKKLNSVRREFSEGEWWLISVILEYIRIRIVFLKGDISGSVKENKKFFYSCSRRNYDAMTANCALFLGDIFLRSSEFNQSDLWYKKGKKIFSDRKNSYGVIYSDFKRTDISIVSGHWSEISTVIKKKLSIDRKLGIKGTSGEVYLKLGKFELIKNNYLKALNLFNKAMGIFSENPFDNSENIEYATFLKVLSVVNLKRKGIKERLVEISETFKNSVYSKLINFIKLLISNESADMKKFLKVIDQVQPVLDRIIFLSLISPLINGSNIVEVKIKEILIGMNSELKNYFHYEYLYNYFSGFDITKHGMKSSDIDDFTDMFFYFNSRGRKMPSQLYELRERIDEEIFKKEIFKSAELIERFKKWYFPEDFFKYLSDQIRNIVSFDVIGLEIFKDGKVIFSFLNKSSFKEIFKEVVQLTINGNEDLSLTLDDIKRNCKSPEKLFYNFRQTDSYIWEISGKLSGVLLIGWKREGETGERKREKIRKTLMEFSGLFEKFYKDVYLINRKLKNIIGKSDGIKELKQIIGKVSKVDFSVLITGESGSGKELVAKAIHTLSIRGKNRFVPLNAASIPENLLEPELFGYAKGAFTDARSDKMGLLEVADEGTFFMDEIGELPLNLQAKLLRAIQENEIKRVGENHSRRINVRFIFATNRDLKKMIKEGKFREDLYYRIQDLVISVPPLRDRKEDIPVLINYFFKKFGFNVPDEKWLNGVKRNLMARKWKGNVRELESEIKRIITFFPEYSENDLTVINNEPDDLSLKGRRDRFEKKIVKETLIRKKWNKTKAAEELQISRTYLFELIKRHNISKDNFS